MMNIFKKLSYMMYKYKYHIVLLILNIQWTNNSVYEATKIYVWRRQKDLVEVKKLNVQKVISML